MSMSRMPRLSRSAAVLPMALVATTLQAQVAPRAPRAPLPAPAPAEAPVLFDIDVRGIAELARAEAQRGVELARLSTAEVLAAAMEGQRLALDGQRLAIEGQVLAALPRGYRTGAPEAWDAQDPADSLYREARKALASDSHQRAAELFKQIRQRYPKSSYAPDAPYWEAFALQRLGGQQNLYLAQDALGLQQRDYPRAATRGDAAALNARIEGMLGRRGDLAAAQSVRGRAERAASDGCPRAGEDERVDALNAVTQMDAERALPILKKVLARREPCTQQLRRTAVWLVARQKSPEAASLLMNAAKSDPDGEVREQAVFWLANVPSDEAVGMLIDLARNSDDLDLRKRAVYALSRAKSERAVATLREITADNRAPEDLRVEALNWYLSRTQKEAAEPLSYLRDVYAKADGTPLKQTVLRYIAGLHTDEARTWLVSLALNDRESLDVRRAAVAYLGSSSGGGYTYTRKTSGQSYSYSTSSSANAPTPPAPPAVPGTPPAPPTPAATSLWQVYEKSGEMELRRQALSMLGSLRDNAGVDKLIEVARKEKNAELRRMAITFLSRSKDPRALELLQEIINK